MRRSACHDCAVVQTNKPCGIVTTQNERPVVVFVCEFDALDCAQARFLAAASAAAQQPAAALNATAAPALFKLEQVSPQPSTSGNTAPATSHCQSGTTSAGQPAAAAAATGTVAAAVLKQPAGAGGGAGPGLPGFKGLKWKWMQEHEVAKQQRLEEERVAAEEARVRCEFEAPSMHAMNALAVPCRACDIIGSLHRQ
jgi:hypothetical protein